MPKVEPDLSDVAKVEPEVLEPLKDADTVPGLGELDEDDDSDDSKEDGEIDAEEYLLVRSQQKKSQTFICALCHVGYITEEAIRAHIREKHLPTFDMNDHDSDQEVIAEAEQAGKTEKTTKITMTNNCSDQSVK